MDDLPERVYAGVGPAAGVGDRFDASDPAQGLLEDLLDRAPVGLAAASREEIGAVIHETTKA